MPRPTPWSQTAFGKIIANFIVGVAICILTGIASIGVAMYNAQMDHSSRIPKIEDGLAALTKRVHVLENTQHSYGERIPAIAKDLAEHEISLTSLKDTAVDNSSNIKFIKERSTRSQEELSKIKDTLVKLQVTMAQYLAVLEKRNERKKEMH